MTGTMTEPEPRTSGEGEAGRVRLIIDTEDIIRRAVARRVHKEGLRTRRDLTKSEVVTEILRAALAEEIAELEAGPPDPGPATRRGRKPKGGGGK
jgi:hypothetical protein